MHRRGDGPQVMRLWTLRCNPKPSVQRKLPFLLKLVANPVAGAGLKAAQPSGRSVPKKPYGPLLIVAAGSGDFCWGGGTLMWDPHNAYVALGG